MAAKQFALVGLLVGLGMYSYNDALSYVRSLDDPQASKLMSELQEKQAQKDEAELVSDLRKALDAKDAKPALVALNAELSDPDFPMASDGSKGAQAESAQVSELRKALEAKDAKPALVALNGELSDPDFPSPY